MLYKVQDKTKGRIGEKLIKENDRYLLFKITLILPGFLFFSIEAVSKGQIH